jgi:hypothetical protein
LLVLTALAALSLPPVAAQPPAPPPLVLTFDTSSVTVGGATAGGEVVLYRVSREWTGRSTRIRETAQVLTASAEGTAVLELPVWEEIPVLSLWIAADLTTGSWAAGSPEGFEAPAMVFPGRAPVPGTPGTLRRLELTGRTFHALVVRPGSDPARRGAWSAAVGDGGVLDDDGPGNGRMGFEVAVMQPVGESPALAEMAGGDLLAVIDPETLEHLVIPLVGAPEGGK